MSQFFLSLAVFGLFYFPLRLLEENWVRLSLPDWWVYLAGILSWAAVLSMAGPPIALLAVCVDVVRSLSMGAAFEAAGLLFLAGIIANLVVVHREVLDLDHVLPFMRTSMMFRNYFKEEEDLFQQLEKKKIRDIHREITGKELVEPSSVKKELPHLDPATARRVLQEERSKPVHSVHLADEIQRLSAGETVDITDPFTVNTFKHPTHVLYKLVHEMRIDPTTRLLSFHIHCAQITSDTTLSRDVVIRLEQDLYDALQALIAEPWLKPYSIYIEKISVTCFRVLPDSFDLPRQHPFLQLDIPIAELQVRAGKFYSVADLPAIATITMLES
ncbi:MAG TPA: hypothetical protein VMM37_09670 [Bacteroidota bacterium]|nr:hypothetical protein [Bacteroidota bacterium]